MRARVVAATLGAALALAVLPAVPAGATDRGMLARARQATAQFHDLEAATDAGYVQFLPCFDDGVASGMGQHFAMLPLDDIIDALHPEVLVYEPHHDGYKLVALEYVVPQLEQWTDENPPMLFGEPFHRNDDLGIWALHAWIWRGNPTGVHEDFSPNVRMCPTAS